MEGAWYCLFYFLREMWCTSVIPYSKKKKKQQSALAHISNKVLLIASPFLCSLPQSSIVITHQLFRHIAPEAWTCNIKEIPTTKTAVTKPVCIHKQYDNLPHKLQKQIYFSNCCTFSFAFLVFTPPIIFERKDYILNLLKFKLIITILLTE